MMKAIEVRKDNGCYTIPCEAEEEDWDAVTDDALIDDGYDVPERFGPLTGWGEWEDVYVIRGLLDVAEPWLSLPDRWFFVREE